jgi:hypothetical protein
MSNSEPHTFILIKSGLGKLFSFTIVSSLQVFKLLQVFRFSTPDGKQE